MHARRIAPTSHWEPTFAKTVAMAPGKGLERKSIFEGSALCNHMTFVCMSRQQIHNPCWLHNKFGVKTSVIKTDLL